MCYHPVTRSDVKEAVITSPNTFGVRLINHNWYHRGRSAIEAKMKHIGGCMDENQNETKNMRIKMKLMILMKI